MSSNTPTPFPEEYSRTELNHLYRENGIDNKTSVKLRRYLNAMSNLYGIITVPKAYEIIQSQSNPEITEELYYNFIDIARHEIEEYFIIGEAELYIDGQITTLKEKEVINVALLDSELEVYHNYLRAHSNKPYYVPNKTTLLKYSNFEFYEPNAQTEALKEFFVSKLKYTAQVADAYVTDVIACLTDMEISKPFDHALKWVERRKLIKNSNYWETFVELLTAVNNNCRSAYNRGHTPIEIAEMMPDKSVKSIELGPNILKSFDNRTMNPIEFGMGILQSDLPDEIKMDILRQMRENSSKSHEHHKSEQGISAKVGRNDPCPCGSGKKYKKCCGRST